MQASESSISVGLYKTHHRYTDAQPVEVEVSYKGNGMSSPQLAFASTEYYRIGTKLTVTGYLNEGWRKNWGGWDFASTQMTARLYINGNDCGELNIENVYSVTHSEIVSSTLNKISIVVTANTYNSILDGNKPGKANGTIAALAAGDMEFVQNVTIDSHNNWTAVVSDLPTKENDGEDIYYYVTEFSLYGYTISYQNNGVLAGVGGNPIVVINKADEKVKTASFSINKVDASTATPQPLEGASFALYRAVKNDQNQLIRVGLPIATAISNASGTGVVFSGLIPGEYLLYETSAPTGYVTPSEPWRITVNNDCVVDAHGLQANSDGAYIIENGKYPGILSITKKVEGYEMEEGMHYYIKVTLTDAADKPLTGSFNGIRLENGSAIYELVKDATITFTGLPLGTKYTVEEVNFDGTALTGEEEYTSSLSTNATGTIDKEAGTVAVNVTVTNIYEIPETSAVISVKKIVDGTGYNQNEAFEFTLSAAEEGIPMPTETGNKVSIKAGETGSFGSITYTDTGIYYYTVKETKGSTVGMSYDETEYPVTVVVSMNDEHKLTASVYYNVVMTDIPEVEIDVRALVVTNTYRVTSVSGTKTWRVPEGSELPESITVILNRNGSPVDSKKVTAADDWSYEFTELPAYSEDGSTAYTYTVDEEPVEGYITTVSGTNLINTITGTTSVSGTKIWRAPEGTELPESITVILNRNDEPVARKKVTAADDWSYEFTELPAYSEDGSTAYTYTVDEEPVAGYNKEVDGYDLINTKSEKIEITGTKTWRAPEGTELPESITVILNRNDEPVARKKVTAADDWSYEFTELPAYSEDGSTAYTYTVDEEPVEGYITTVSGTNLINTITGTTSVSGTKTWRVPEGTELPESITVILNRNDEPVARKKVTAADDWSYEFTELPAYSEDGSTAYTYTVDEEPVEGYITTVSGTNLINTITGTTSVSGTKTWRVPEGTELPESITVILKRNDEPVARKKVTAADDWSYEFTELPAYSEDGSTAYTYTVDEEPVEGYITTVSETNLINTITGTTSVSGTKTWRVPEGTKLPESITVILNRNDEPVARKKVTAADDWSYEFTELPAYSEDGSTAYTYTVDEEPVEGYITTVSETNLINTITSVKISKVDIADGEELEGATIQLIDKETGEVVEEWTSTNEAHEVTGLTTGKTYILRETVAPEGYGITSDTTFELKEDGSIDTEKTTTTVSEEGVLLVEDTRRIDFIVNKVSATDDHELYDTILSVYEITDEGEVLVDSWTSRWKEVHNFGLKLSCGKSYILREDKATGGYHKIPGDILFNVTADGKIQITEGQDWKYENGKNVIEEVVDEAGNVIYLIRDVRNPEEEEETEPDGPTDPHQSETTTPEETTTSEEETTPEETTTSEEETSPEETTVSEEETTVSEEETTLPSPDDEESTPEVTTPAANITTTAAETTVSETPTTTPSSERVILGIEDMSRTIGMALAGFGAIMLTALIWLYLRSKKA